MTDSTRLVYTTTIHPRWSDQDRLGHVNNAEYFRYFEEARIRWLDSLDEQVDRNTEGPVVAAIDCNYLQSITYPCPLSCELASARLGNSSFKLQHRLLELASGAVMAEGAATLVWVNRETGKPCPVPDALRKILA